jgi:Protein of unknown function (DUF1360)
MEIPNWWTFFLLALASFRLWHLLSEDTILDVPRRKLVRLPLDWEEGRPIPASYRAGLARFINCGWCLGFHVSLWVYILWLIVPSVVMPACVVLSLATVVPFLAQWADEEASL